MFLVQKYLIRYSRQSQSTLIEQSSKAVSGSRLANHLSFQGEGTEQWDY